jgi:hypothetical protein
MSHVRSFALRALLLLAVGAYADACAGVFLFDDRAVILDDARLESPVAFVEHAGQTIRPFTKLTFLIDRQLYGTRPAGYHLLNVLLHLASGVFAWSIVRRLGASGEVAFWSTALFLLHPIGTEAVTYISGRPTSLMTCCYLAAFFLFLKAREPGAHGWSWRVLVASACGCVALSLLAKETAVVFPALLALYEALRRQLEAGPEHGADTSPSRAVAVHLAFGTVALIFLAAAANHTRYVYLFRYGLDLRGVWENLVTEITAVAYALTLFLWPPRLNFDHDIAVSASLLAPGPLAALCALALLVGVAFATARRHPLVTFGILWFFIHLLPTNSVFPRYDILSERNLYLPSVGLYLAGVVAASAAARRAAEWVEARHPAGARGAARLRGTGSVMAALLVIALAGATAARNHLYSDPVLFWADAARKSPGKARPHTNLGCAWFEAGQIDRAIDEFRSAIALDPTDPVAQRNLRVAWMQKAGAQGRKTEPHGIAGR